MEGVLFCGNRSEEIGIKFFRMFIDQDFLSSGDVVLQRDLVMELGIVQYFFGGELGGILIINVSILEIVGEMEYGFMNLDVIV